MTETRDEQPVGMQILGSVLRQLRTGAGLTQEQLARKVNYARSQVSNTEQGREMPSADFLAACDQHFGTGTMLAGIRKTTLTDSLPGWALELQDAEARAVSIFSYETLVIPGLLQTVDYAAAMLSAGMWGDPDEDALKERVANRLQRQRIFEKKPRPDYWVILAESVIHRDVGGREVMRQQLAHLLDAMARRLVNVQILPNSAGAATLDAPVVLLDMGDGTVLMHTEGPIAGSTTSRPDLVRECRKRFDALRALSATLGDSAQIVRARMEALEP